MEKTDSLRRKHHTLKKWIVLLLGVSCLVSLFLYFSWSPADNRQIRNAAELDSLIQINFDSFNITSSQVRTRSITIDTIATRKVYTVEVPPGFSKTQWHYELNKLVRPYQLNTPAQVHFPERNISIHLTNDTNTIRTIHLQTNPDLVLYRDFATVILAFDRPPSENTLNQIRSLGEPVQLAIRSGEPRTDFDRIRDFRREYPHTIWWLKNSSGNSYSTAADMDRFLNRLELLNQLDSGARVLFLNPYEEIDDHFKQRMGRLNLLLVDISEALTIDDLDDQQQVEQIKQQLLERSSWYWPPTVIVEGTNSNLRELQRFITVLKHDHVQLRSPYFIDL